MKDYEEFPMKVVSLIVLSLILCLLVIYPSKTMGEAMSPPSESVGTKKLAGYKKLHATGGIQYWLNVSASSCEVSIYINEIHFENVVNADSSFFVSDFLINGENEIRVIWQTTGKATGSFKIELEKWKKEEARQDAVKLIEYKDAVKEISRVRKEKSFVVRIDFPVRWIWEDSPIIKILSEEDENKIKEKVETFYNAFKNKDVNKVIELTRFAKQDVALAMFIDSEKLLKTLRESYIDTFKDPKFEMRPLNWQRIKIKPYSKLVKIHGEPYIFSSTEYRKGFKTAISALYFAKVDGEWVLVRIR